MAVDMYVTVDVEDFLVGVDVDVDVDVYAYV